MVAEELGVFVTPRKLLLSLTKLELADGEGP